MAMGPVQILVIGYGQDAQFTGAALDELRRLIDHDVVRLVDLQFVHKNDDGSIENPQASFDFRRKIDMPGRVEKVDRDVLPMESNASGINRNAALLFLRIIIGFSGP